MRLKLRARRHRPYTQPDKRRRRPPEETANSGYRNARRAAPAPRPSSHQHSSERTASARTLLPHTRLPGVRSPLRCDQGSFNARPAHRSSIPDVQPAPIPTSFSQTRQLAEPARRRACASRPRYERFCDRGDQVLDSPDPDAKSRSRRSLRPSGRPRCRAKRARSLVRVAPRESAPTRLSR